MLVSINMNDHHNINIIIYQLIMFVKKNLAEIIFLCDVSALCTIF